MAHYQKIIGSIPHSATNLMPETKRQKIVAVLIDAIKEIKIENDFQTDLGNSVEDWRTDWQEEDLPGTSVCDLIAERVDAADEIDFFKLPVQIRTSFSSNVRPALARRFLGDIIKALRPWHQGFKTETETLAARIDLTREGFVLAEDGFSVAAVAVEIEVFYHTRKFNAFV